MIQYKQRLAGSARGDTKALRVTPCALHQLTLCGPRRRGGGPSGCGHGGGGCHMTRASRRLHSRSPYESLAHMTDRMTHGGDAEVSLSREASARESSRRRGLQTGGRDARAKPLTLGVISLPPRPVVRVSFSSSK